MQPFTVLVLCNLGLIHANRSFRPAGWRSPAAAGVSNRMFGWMTLVTLGLLAAVLFLPRLAPLFAFEQPAPSMLLAWVEAAKWQGSIKLL